MLAAACAMVLMHVNGKLIDGLWVGGLALYFLAIVGTLGAVGMVLCIHRQRNAIGWIFLVCALSNAISGIVNHYALYITETSPGRLPEIPLLFWLTSWLWILLFALPPTFGILLFPTGRLPSRRWRPFAWLVGGWIALVITSEMFSPGPLDTDSSAPIAQFTNPVGVESLAGFFDAVVASSPLVGVLLLCGTVASVFARLRGVTAVERQQIKWFAYAVAFSLSIVFIYGLLLLVTGIETNETLDSSIWLLGIVMLPVAIGIAILRHNLYDIDRLINRSLVYGILTAALLTTYFAIVLGLGGLVRAVTGESSSIVVAVSTLAVAGLFRPLRARIQGLVDRRFYRHKYDAARTLDAFSARLRDELDLDTLTGELRHIIEDTMQPVGMSVWLRPRTSPQVPDLAERRKRERAVRRTP